MGLRKPLCQYERIERFQISGEAYHMEQDNQYHHYDIENSDIHMQPFNLSSFSNDSGIASPTYNIQDKYRHLHKLNFDNNKGAQNENYDIGDSLDYDRCFPPLSPSGITKLTRSIGRTMDIEDISLERNLHHKVQSKVANNFQNVQKTRNGARMIASKRNGQTKRACVYCKRMGKNESMFDSHCLRNPITGKLMCPLLVDNACDLCGDTKDDLVHTTSDCTNSSQKQGGFMTFDPLLKHK